MVVEIPNDCLGTRSLVKLKHEGDIGEDAEYSAFSTVHKSRFEGAAWSSVASWHVEIHAPPGLAIAALTSEVSDSDDVDTQTLSASPVVGHTAHISGQTTAVGSIAFADLELRPASAGLVNQTVAGAAAAMVLLTAGLIWNDRLFEAVKDPNRGSAVAAVMLAIPAFLIALVSRGPEHRLVSRLLLVPRLVNLAVATVLLATAVALVLGLAQDALAWTLRGLWSIQVVLLFVAMGVRNRSVGGRP